MVLIGQHLSSFYNAMDKVDADKNYLKKIIRQSPVTLRNPVDQKILNKIEFGDNDASCIHRQQRRF